MRDNAMTNRLVCTWVAVVDQTGHAHMEARWSQARATAAHAA